MQRPPAGAGDCAAPKLLQYAFTQGYTPIAMAEFWWGGSSSEVRKNKHYYPACRGKCEPILNHMLVGLDVESIPVSERLNQVDRLEVLFEDEHIIAVNKPAEFASLLA